VGVGTQGRHPDPRAARALVDGLAQAVSANCTALENHDNYAFTHMVDVSILTMSQARALGIDGSPLRELGLAALMHDIGKVRAPSEILNKPDKLTDSEFAIMRMHVVDGAEILRRTAEMPAAAPIIAFEHRLRLTGTGYPFGGHRTGLNLGTMLCSIADVYDAIGPVRLEPLAPTIKQCPRDFVAPAGFGHIAAPHRLPQHAQPKPLYALREGHWSSSFCVSRPRETMRKDRPSGPRSLSVVTGSKVQTLNRNRTL